jgi:hypothetical protein
MRPEAGVDQVKAVTSSYTGSCSYSRRPMSRWDRGPLTALTNSNPAVPVGLSKGSG